MRNAQEDSSDRSAFTVDIGDDPQFYNLDRLSETTGNPFELPIEFKVRSIDEPIRIYISYGQRDGNTPLISGFPTTFRQLTTLKLKERYHGRKTCLPLAEVAYSAKEDLAVKVDPGVSSRDDV